MGVLEKIKNALFEVEYVEVDDAPKKEKKSKPKETDKEEVAVEKPIAKKIVLPGKKEEKVEQLEEEELRDEDFEIRPKNEMVKEVFKDNFNVMDDDDFTSPPTTAEPVHEEDATTPVVEAPVVPVVVTEPQTEPPTQPPIYQETTYANKDYVKEYDSYKEKVQSTIEDHSSKPRESRPYGMDPSYRVSIKEYGSENKDEKSYFKPSPIISPIYGILDKNYKKEDVVTKKEIRITSSYTRSNMNVDDIRNKAYGRRSDEEFVESPVVIETTPVTTPRSAPVFEKEEEEENLLVDLSDEKKPEVKEITMGDAMEYFQDLGLEYNVDYVDASIKNPPKKKPDDLEEDIKDTMNTPSTDPVVEEMTPVTTPPTTVPETEPPKETTPVTEPVVEEKVAPKIQPVEEERVEVKESPVVEVKDETNGEKTSTLDEDDDNLFDLIDSMYREEDN